jgi:hypothetical protein
MKKTSFAYALDVDIIISIRSILVAASLPNGRRNSESLSVLTFSVYLRLYLPLGLEFNEREEIGIVCSATVYTSVLVGFISGI